MCVFEKSSGGEKKGEKGRRGKEQMMEKES